MSTSTSSAAGSTATVAVEVWMRPEDSVTGTRWTRWTPDSCFSREYAFLPLTSSTISLNPPRSEGEAESTSVFQRWRSAWRWYISYSVPAHSAASSPPAPARISTTTSLPSLGSLGTRRASRRVRSSAARASAVSASPRRNAAISGSGSSLARLVASSACCRAARYSRNGATISPSSDRSLPSLRRRSGSFATSGDAISPCRRS